MQITGLIEIIKRYNESTDYAYSTQIGGISSPDSTRNSDFGKEIYDIYSPELKKEVRGLVLNGDTEDGGFFRFGAEVEGKWYQYEKGEGNQPDKFTISEISSEDKKRKEQAKIDREQAFRDREQAQRDHQDRFTFYGKKCAECSQEIDPSKGCIGSKPDGQEEWLHFCSVNCSNKNFDKKQGKGENNADKKQEDSLKCGECGDTPEGKYYWEWIGTGDKIYCLSCSDKLPKISETELEKREANAIKSMKIRQEQTKLEELKSKLQDSTNSAEKERLKQMIKDTETRLKDLENKSKNNSNQSLDHPNKGYGKIILAGIAIFSVAILASILVVKTRKRTAKRKK